MTGRVRRGASVLLVLAVSSCASLPTVSSAGRGSGLDAHPATITVNGRTETRMAQQHDARTAFLDAHDSRLLKLAYEMVEYTAASASLCAPPDRPFAYVVREDRRSVVLDIGGYRPVRPPDQRDTTAAFGCAGRITGYRMLPVRLHNPLGRRSVTNVLFREPIEVVTEQSVPKPRYLPPGYAPRGGLEIGLFDQVQRRYVNGPWQITVEVRDPRTPVPFPPQGSRTTVGRFAARMEVEDGSYTITWTEPSGRTFDVDAGQQESVGSGESGPDISPAQLLRVARSLY